MLFFVIFASQLLWEETQINVFNSFNPSSDWYLSKIYPFVNLILTERRSLIQYTWEKLWVSDDICFYIVYALIDTCEFYMFKLLPHLHWNHRRPNWPVNSAAEAKPPAYQAGSGCYLNFWLRRSNGALVGPLNTPSLTHVSQSKGFLPRSQWLQNIKRLGPLAGCLAWMLYEQSNAIRVDCVIFQSVSTLQPDGRHVMNMKRCLRGLPELTGFCTGEENLGLLQHHQNHLTEAPDARTLCAFTCFTLGGKDSNISEGIKT